VRGRARTVERVTKGRAFFPAGLFGVSLAVLLLRWLVPGPIGAADNGDGWRLLCPLGASEPERVLEDWVQMTYRPSPVCGSDYVSSQAWFQRAAQWIGHVLGSDDALDLYVLGTLTCVLVAGAVTCLVLGLPLPWRGRAVAAVAVLLVLADSAVFGWFVSVLSEGAAVLGITTAVAGLLLMQRPDRRRFVGAVLAVGGAVIGLNAKVQTLLLLPALVLALLLVRKVGTRVITRWALPLGVLVATLAGTVVVQTSGAAVGGEYQQVNAYHAIFDGIVREDHAEEDLAELGLPASFARYQGTGWWGERPAHTDPLWPEYQHLVSRRNVAEYYLQHPLRTVEILNAGARDQLTARPGNLGSFPEGSGEPARAQEFRVPVLSGISGVLAPLGLFALVPLWGLTAAAAVLSWRRARPVAVVTFFVLVGGWGQFAAAALGEGSAEGVKHQVIALFCTFLGVVLGGLGLLARRYATRDEAAVRADRDAAAGDVRVPA
jgi:hypothetical protein